MPPHSASDSSLRVAVWSGDPTRRRRLVLGLVDSGFAVVGRDESADVTVVVDAEGPESAPSVVLVSSAAAARAALRGLVPLAVLAPDASLAEIAAAVVAVAEGLTVVAPEFRALLAEAPPGPRLDPETPVDLTPRELEVLQLLALGLPNKTIASRLSISENTVKYHVASIYSKLDAQSRAEAVMRAARLGLVPL